ncbi:VCBS repeat-containing protein [Streptomyces sp. NBC_00250]|uniref:FG-GAP repeat domain-containing protein n=1 Tax=Streptomyces sp. NBC_00250 TaxID=2903641 RepID=UPI002E2E2352|nr:VCBS repeat-containing protein [Streptomyces sp. NBC_00250]
MSVERTYRTRLAAAVTVALAVTLGTLTAGPALATTATVAGTAAATAAQQDAIALLPDSAVLGNGPSGFLTRHRDSFDTGDVYRWTRYEDGVTTVLPAGKYTGSAQSDVIVKIEGATYKLYDMATGAAPVVIDTSSLGTSAKFVQPAGSTLVMEAPRAGGGTDVHLVSKPGDTLVDRTVSGLPATAAVRWYDRPSPGTLVIRHGASWSSTLNVALVDIATARVVEDRVLTAGNYDTKVTASATHLAWAEYDSAESATLQVARRGQEGTTRLPLGKGPLSVGFLGEDWLAYAVSGGTRALSPNPLHSLTVRSLTGDRTVKLLDTVSQIHSDVDGGLLVQGGTIEHGEGLYRITPGQDGATPTATLVASTGRPIVLELADQIVPATIDFGTRDANLIWQFAGPADAALTVELKHTATGKKRILTTTLNQQGRANVWWDGTFGDLRAAHNGDYTWRMTAVPRNGIGPSVERTGVLKVAGKQAPHDFTDSSSPDLVYRSGGHLLFYDARQVFASGQVLDSTQEETLAEAIIGGGWDTYDQIVTPGNIGGTPHADLIGRDKTGVLWSYAGTGKAAEPFAPRTRVGGGWGIYKAFAGGSDVTGDGRSDLLATDTAGTLWLYKGTGSTTAPFATRVKVGGGWGVYNKLVATGNIGGGPAGDLVARDTAGVLWLYLGKGDGTFAARTRIGSGWNRYDEIVAIGDADRDGRPDLMANDSVGGGSESLSLYKGTGDWRAPFTSRAVVDTPVELTNMPLL